VLSGISAGNIGSSAQTALKNVIASVSLLVSTISPNPNVACIVERSLWTTLFALIAIRLGDGVRRIDRRRLEVAVILIVKSAGGSLRFFSIGSSVVSRCLESARRLSIPRLLAADAVALASAWTVRT
jgi:hypothetical protein